MGALLDEEVRKKVLNKITPTKEEILNQQKMIARLSNQLETYGKRRGIKYETIEAHGSTGKKQTQLKGSSDIDLFVALNPSDYDRILSLSQDERDRKLTELLDGFVDNWFYPAFKELNPTKLQKIYSEHPYLSLHLEGQEIDVVCCFNLSRDEIAAEGTITAVDRTLHHTSYIIKHLKKSMRSDIRILKSFVRAAHVYGDKCAIGRMGFTGYALELLVINSGDFEGAIRQIKALEKKPIDPADRSLDELKNKHEFHDDYIFIIDPTDYDRNVAASFDSRGYKWLKLRCDELLKTAKRAEEHNMVHLLIEGEIPTEPLPQWLKPHSLSVEFQSVQPVHYTILRDKLYKLASKIVARMKEERTGEKRFGKTLAEVYFENDRFALGIVVEKANISPEYDRKGPPLKMDEACTKFMKANSQVFKQGGYLWSKEKRKFTSANAFFQYLVKRETIKGLERTKKSIVSDRVLNTLYRYVMQVEEIPVERGNQIG
ncbi:MAG: nucleotidyltransferase domain-containing protein [Candidatus Thorarchaeota archaeon]